MISRPCCEWLEWFSHSLFFSFLFLYNRNRKISGRTANIATNPGRYEQSRDLIGSLLLVYQPIFFLSSETIKRPLSTKVFCSFVRQTLIFVWRGELQDTNPWKCYCNYPPPLPFPRKGSRGPLFQCLPKRNVLHFLLSFCISPHKMSAFDIPDPVNASPPIGGGGSGRA